ncbi:MAG: molecular chaperone Tir [Candidatus Cloacimonetes bacterium 4572_55]|nr:MAG: molecular chaperone Tir [Candidatus Cloacimonetes bacterium 4572_55]
MPALKTYKLFISHSWAYGDVYDKLVQFFNEHSNFAWSNYSVPKDSPIHNANNDTKLYNAIKTKIAPVNCVVMLAGVYSTCSKWINKEIQISKSDYYKPIIAVEPWASEKTSKIVKDNANEIVKWQSKSIVDAIRRHSI